MNKTRVSVYRNADFNCDCTNHGITSRLNSATMFWDCTREEAVEWCVLNEVNPNDCLYVVKRMLWGKDHSFATPLIMKSSHSMFGGNFVFTSDSNCFHFGGETTSRPIPVHDRFE